MSGGGAPSEGPPPLSRNPPCSARPLADSVELSVGEERRLEALVALEAPSPAGAALLHPGCASLSEGALRGEKEGSGTLSAEAAVEVPGCGSAALARAAAPLSVAEGAPRAEGYELGGEVRPEGETDAPAVTSLDAPLTRSIQSDDKTVSVTVSQGTLAIYGRDAKGNVVSNEKVLDGPFTGTISWPASLGNTLPVYSDGLTESSNRVSVHVETYNPAANPWEFSCFKDGDKEPIGFRIGTYGTGSYLSVDQLKSGNPFDFEIDPYFINPGFSKIEDNGTVELQSSNNPFRPVFAESSLVFWGYDANKAGCGEAVMCGSFSGSVTWDISQYASMPVGKDALITVKVDKFTPNLTEHSKQWTDDKFKRNGVSPIGFSLRSGCGEGYVSVASLEVGGPFEFKVKGSSLNAGRVNSDKSVTLSSSNYPFNPVYPTAVTDSNIAIWSRNAAGSADDSKAVIEGKYTGTISWPNEYGTTIPASDTAPNAPITINANSFSKSANSYWSDDFYKVEGKTLIGFKVREGCGYGSVSIKQLESGSPFQLTINRKDLGTVSTTLISSLTVPLEPVYSNNHTATFDANGGTPSPQTTTCAWLGSLALPSIEPTRTGYDFAGWFTAKSGGVEVTSSTQISTASAPTYYAQWKAKTSTVTLDRSSATTNNSPITVTATYDSAMPAVSLGAMRRSGYLFDGFVDADGNKYYDETGTSIRNWNKTDSTFTLTASWKKDSVSNAGYVEIYSTDKQGAHVAHAPILGTITGSVSWADSYGETMPNVSYHPEATVSVRAESFAPQVKNWNNDVFKKDGCTLIGFSVRPGCGSGYVSISDLEAGSRFELELSARYLESASKVNADGSLVVVSRANPLEPVYDHDITSGSISVFSRTANNTTNPSYSPLSGTFKGAVGWANSKGESIPNYNNRTETGADTLVNIKLTEYTPNGKAVYNNDAFKKEGYELQGFRVREGCGDGFISLAALSGDAAAMPISFALTAECFSATYDGTNKSGWISSMNWPLEPVLCATTTSGTLEIYATSSDETASYSDKPMIGGAFEGSVSWPPAMSASLPNTNTSSSKRIPVTINVTKFVSNTPYPWEDSKLKKEGHELVGFKVKSVAGDGYVSIETLRSGGAFTLVLYPNFIDSRSVADSTRVYVRSMHNPLAPVYQEKVTHTFSAPEASDASLREQTTESLYSGKVKLPATNPTRIGYDFDGWYTAANKGGTKVTADTYVSSVGTTFYAGWTPYSYSVVYRGNGNTDGKENITDPDKKTYDVEFTTKDANTFARTGYILTAWKDAASNQLYNPNASVKNLTATKNGTVNLDAVWTGNKYKVKLNTDDATSGATGIQEITATYGSPMPQHSGVSNIPCKVGFVFNGYADDAGKYYYDANGMSVANWDKAEDNVTLTAQWLTTNEVNAGSIQIWSKGAGGSTSENAPLFGTFKGSVTWDPVYGSNIPNTSIANSKDALVRIHVDSFKDEHALWNHEDYAKEGCEILGFAIRSGCGSGYVSIESLENGDPFDLSINAYYLAASTKINPDGTVSIISTREPLEPVYDRTIASGGITVWSRNAENKDQGGKPPIYGSFTGSVAWANSKGEIIPSRENMSTTGKDALVTITLNTYTPSGSHYDDDAYKKTGYELLGFKVREDCGSGFVSIDSLKGETNALPFSITLKAEYFTASTNADGKLTIDSYAYPLEPVFGIAGTGTGNSIKLYSKGSDGVTPVVAPPIEGTFEGTISWSGAISESLPNASSSCSPTTPVVIKVSKFSPKTSGWTSDNYKVEGSQLVGFKVRSGCGSGFISIDALNSGGAFELTLYATSISPASHADAENGLYIQSANWPLMPVYERTYTHTFNASGGTPESLTVESLYSGNLVLPTNDPTRTGYTFAGWYTSADGGDKVTSETPSPKEDTTYYAHWTAHTYTVKYTDGTNTIIDSAEKTYDVNFTTKGADTFNKEGHTLTAWKLEGAETSYDVGAETKNLTANDKGEVTLVAQWTPNNYTVIYKGNEGKTTDGKTEITDPDKTYGVSFNTLGNDAFVRAGYNLVKWKDAKGNLYEPGKSVVNLTADNNGSVTLTAQWEGKSYEVTLDQNGATSGATENKIIDVVYGSPMPSNSGVANIPRKSGYIFEGYADDKGVKYYDATGGSLRNWDKAENAILKAQWALNPYITAGAIKIYSVNSNNEVIHDGAPIDGTFKGSISWDSSYGEKIPNRTTDKAENALVTVQVDSFVSAGKGYESADFKKDNATLVGFRVRQNAGEGYVGIEDITSGAAFTLKLKAAFIETTSVLNQDGTATFISYNNPLEPVYEWVCNEGSFIQVWSHDKDDKETDESPICGKFIGSASWQNSKGDKVPIESGNGGTDTYTLITINVDDYDPDKNARYDSEVYKKTGYNLLGFKVREGCGEGFVNMNALQGNEAFSITLTSNSFRGTLENGIASFSSNNWPLEPVYGIISESGSNSMALTAVDANGQDVPEAPVEGTFDGTVQWPAAQSKDLPKEDSTCSPSTEVTLIVNSFTPTEERWNDEVYQQEGSTLTGFRVRSGMGSGYVSLDTLKNHGAFQLVLYPGSISSESYANDDGISIKTVGNPLMPVYERTYTHTFDANGGTPATQNTKALYTGNVVLPTTTPTYEGHTFLGWFTEQTDGVQVTNDTATPKEDTTYYAHWRTHTYKVVYKGNGGEATNGDTEITDVNIAYDAQYTIRGADTFARDGYTLTSWKIDGDTTTYKPGSSVSKLTAKDSGTVTLLAQWTPKSYGISFTKGEYKMNANDTEATDVVSFTESDLSVTSSDIGYDTNSKLWTGSKWDTLATFTFPNPDDGKSADQTVRKGYRLVGWKNVSPNARQSKNYFAAGEQWSGYTDSGTSTSNPNHTTIYQDVVTFEAVYEAQPLVIEFAPGATTATAKTGPSAGSLKAQTVAAPTDTKANFVVTYTYRDKWDTAGSTSFASQKLPAVADMFERSGYTSNDWSQGGTARNDSTLLKDIGYENLLNTTAVPVITAQWSNKSFWVNLATGTEGASLIYSSSDLTSLKTALHASELKIENGILKAEFTYYDAAQATELTTAAQALPAPKDAYSLNGYFAKGAWRLGAVGSASDIPSGAMSQDTMNALFAADPGKAIYADFTQNYVITFELNGGTNASENQWLASGYSPYDSRLPFTLVSTSKAGYTFKGWFKDQAMTEGITEITSSTGSVTLYAKFEANAYTVSFDSNYAKASNNNGTGFMPNDKTSPVITDGTGAVVTQLVYDKTYTVTGGFSAEGFSLVGWSTDANYTTTGYSGNGKFFAVTNNSDGVPTATITNATESGNAELHAIWAERTYNIKFDLNGADNEEATSGVADSLKGEGGNTIFTTVSFSGSFNVPDVEPTLIGRSFNGWMSSANPGIFAAKGQTGVTPASLGAKNSSDTITLKAAWVNKAFNVTFNGGATDAVVTNGFTPDSSGSDPSNPTVTLSYTFDTGRAGDSFKNYLPDTTSMFQRYGYAASTLWYTTEGDGFEDGETAGNKYEGSEYQQSLDTSALTEASYAAGASNTLKHSDYVGIYRLCEMNNRALSVRWNPTLSVDAPVRMDMGFYINTGTSTRADMYIATNSPIAMDLGVRSVVDDPDPTKSMAAWIFQDASLEDRAKLQLDYVKLAPVVDEKTGQTRYEDVTLGSASGDGNDVDGNIPLFGTSDGEYTWLVKNARLTDEEIEAGAQPKILYSGGFKLDRNGCETWKNKEADWKNKFGGNATGVYTPTNMPFTKLEWIVIPHDGE